MAEVELPNPEEIREHGRDRFGRRVALVTAVYAVMLALAALGGNHAMKEMLLAQQKSSDQWAFYQAKVIREHQYRGQRLRLEADLIERGDAMKPAARERIEALTAELRTLSQHATREMERIGVVVTRLEDVTAKVGRLVSALAGLTQVGQLAGAAVGIKKGLAVFVRRLRDK